MFKLKILLLSIVLLSACSSKEVKSPEPIGKKDKEPSISSTTTGITLECRMDFQGELLAKYGYLIAGTPGTGEIYFKIPDYNPNNQGTDNSADYIAASTESYLTLKVAGGTATTKISTVKIRKDWPNGITSGISDYLYFYNWGTTGRVGQHIQDSGDPQSNSLGFRMDSPSVYLNDFKIPNNEIKWAGFDNRTISLRGIDGNGNPTSGNVGAFGNLGFSNFSCNDGSTSPS